MKEHSESSKMSPNFLNLERELEGKGYAVVKGVSLADANASLLAVVEQFGMPRSFFDQPMIMDVKPKPGHMARSYAGTGAFELHTDLTFSLSPPRWLTMLCLLNDNTG
jgi:hypothetical protein